MMASIVGAILWFLFLEQALLGVDWPQVRAWQAYFAYKVVTGTALGTFIAFQWLLAFCRTSGYARIAKALYSWHQTAGVLAPVLLFLHSTRFGVGYLVAVTSVYCANNLVGIVHAFAFPRLKSFLAGWTIAHIALSVLLAALAGYHAWTALYYE